MSTYQWQNIIDAWRKGSSPGKGRTELDILMGGKQGASSSYLVPFSPDLDRWTEDHYYLYSLIELSLGNRKEVTKEERKEVETAEEIDKMIESGDPNWLQKVEEYFSEGYNIDQIPIDNDFVEEVERYERNYLE